MFAPILKDPTNHPHISDDERTRLIAATNIKSNHSNEASTRTLSPMVTGTSVLAIKFKGGVLMSSDTLGSYGSSARFKGLTRLRNFSDKLLLGAGGDYSDFQYLCKLMEKRMIEEFTSGGVLNKSAHEWHNYITAVMHNRRNKGDPLWNNILLAGINDDGEVFLGSVDLIGTNFEEEFLATGYGKHLALPLLRKHYRKDLSREEAHKILEDAMRVLWYRDCRTINSIQFAQITAQGVIVEEPVELNTDWSWGEKVSHDTSTW